MTRRLSRHRRADGKGCSERTLIMSMNDGWAETLAAALGADFLVATIVGMSWEGWGEGWVREGGEWFGWKRRATRAGQKGQRPNKRFESDPILARDRSERTGQ